MDSPMIFFENPGNDECQILNAKNYIIYNKIMSHKNLTEEYNLTV